MRTRRRTLRLAAPVVLVLAGCANPTTSSEGPPTPSVSPVSPDATPETSPAESPPDLSSTDLPTLTPPTAPPSGPSDVIEKSRISGVLSRSGACAELESPGGRWVLLDLDPRWSSGDDLTVTGLARPERTTSCNGIAYSVISVEQTGS